MAENKLNIAADFAPTSAQEWKDKIIADLKGADFDKKLVWRTPEGFNVQPFYRLEDLDGLQTTASAPGQFPYVRGTKHDNDWYVRQNIVVEDAKAANAKALDVLNKGVNSLGFVVTKSQLNAEFVATLLEGIYAEVIELNFITCPGATPILAGLLAEYFTSKNLDVTKLHGSISSDPIDKMLMVGKNFDREAVTTRLMKAMEAKKLLPGYRTIAVHSENLCNAGAYCAQELAYALAWGAEYMTMLTEAGVDACEAAKAIKFNMGVQGNYFMEIAKFRAARMLWAQIAKAFGACDEACKMVVNATTSTFNMTIFDAYVNLLRSQTEAMSAAISGVDSIVVTPFDVTYKDSDEFSERIARNQQLLLAEESHFSKVIDPAAGSYYLENLTSMIADEAWKRFLAIVEDGGFHAQVLAGKVQEDIDATLAKRWKDVSQRKETLLGTNQFPNFTEKTDGKIVKAAAPVAAACGCQEELGCRTITVHRAAEQFEELRLNTEAAAKAPKAFMLTIGNLAMRLARSQFSCNFFSCAGYEVVDNNGFKTVEEGVDAALAAGADIVVLCSSDDEYAEYAPAAYKYLAGRAIFVVAGAPACMEDLKAAGIENYIHVRVNVLDELKKYSAQLIK
ncbi:MAG: methylmalonyl-CoA mutase small subunit [Paludibacteraceae bacterium]|nr:methylmalonyl-CoA mutase small subunit [Paludibacteraceae bacterium]